VLPSVVPSVTVNETSDPESKVTRTVPVAVPSSSTSVFIVKEAIASSAPSHRNPPSPNPVTAKVVAGGGGVGGAGPDGIQSIPLALLIIFSSQLKLSDSPLLRFFVLDFVLYRYQIRRPERMHFAVLVIGTGSLKTLLR